MENIIVIAALLAAVSGIIWYLVRAKKRGETCVGCPYAKMCGGRRGGGQNPDVSTNTTKMQDIGEIRKQPPEVRNVTNYTAKDGIISRN